MCSISAKNENKKSHASVPLIKSALQLSIAFICTVVVLFYPRAASGIGKIFTLTIIPVPPPPPSPAVSTVCLSRLECFALQRRLLSVDIYQSLPVSEKEHIEGNLTVELKVIAILPGQGNRKGVQKTR